MTKVITALFAFSFAGALTACAPEDDSPDSVSLPGSDSIAVGEIAGSKLVVHEAIAIRVDDPENPGVAIVLTDRAGICAALKDGATLASAHTLTLFVPTADGVPGAETVSSTQCAGGPPFAAFVRSDAQCTHSSGSEIAATAGSVSLTALGLEPGKRTSGSFELELGSDTLAGKFAATFCDVLVTARDPFADASRCQ